MLKQFNLADDSESFGYGYYTESDEPESLFYNQVTQIDSREESDFEDFEENKILGNDLLNREKEYSILYSKIFNISINELRFNKFVRGKYGDYKF